MSPQKNPTVSTRHPRSLAASIACLVAVSSATASAQSPAPAPEAIRVETGSVRCTTSEDFFERVHRRAALTRLASTNERARSFAIAVQGSEPSLHGRLAITHLDGTSSTRDVDGESCDEVVDALALITAIDIDPRAVAPMPPEEMPTVVPIVTGPVPPRDEPRDQLPPLELRAGVSASMTVGIAPVALVGIPVSLELLRAYPGVLSPSLTVGFERSFDRTAVGTDADAAFDITRGSVQGCPLAWAAWRLRFGPCLRVDAGQLRGVGIVGKRLVRPGTERRVWIGLDLAGRGSLSLGSQVYLDLQLGVGTPIVHAYEFQVDPNISLGEVQRVNWRAALGLQVRFL